MDSCLSLVLCGDIFILAPAFFMFFLDIDSIVVYPLMLNVRIPVSFFPPCPSGLGTSQLAFTRLWNGFNEIDISFDNLSLFKSLGALSN